MTLLKTSGLPGMAMVLFLGSSLAGCAHVKPEELNSELAALRTEFQTEMTDNQSQVDGRLGSLEGRVDDLDARLGTVERELADLAQEFDATVQRIDGALRFNMPVYFDFDEAELLPEHREILDRFAGVIREYYPDCLITTEGFTDPVGDADYNLALGLRRAQAVREYLITSGGLGADQVRSVSYGEDQNRLAAPSQHGPGDKGWENRRVALVVDHGGA
jgi:peptidoglycan-associated lipoprotein